MIILGVDPGSRFTGYGLVRLEGSRTLHVENGTLYLERAAKEFSDRLVFLFNEIQKLIDRYHPKALVVENVFYAKNPKSLQKLGEVRGVIAVSAALKGLTVHEYTPLEVKKAITGYGAATKHQMQRMVRTLLNLKDLAEENASDALGLALCYAFAQGRISTLAKTKGVGLNRRQEVLKGASYYR